MNQDNQIANPLPAGTLIDGKFRIERIIGAGGMGVVYEATRLDVNRVVAMKFMQQKYTGDPKAEKRFEREARAAGSIGHDNICEVTETGTYLDSPYLVMPLLRGRSLGGLLVSGELTLGEMIDITAQALSALEAAHNAGIVHRDLKPDNIFVTQMGDRANFVKLLDFGVSKLIHSHAADLTMTGAALGTPHYMAPEQAKGIRKIDQRVDVYAAGVILYEALTGYRPFDGESYNEVMYKIIAEPFRTPRALNPALPKTLEQVILRALEKDPARRFKDAGTMLSALTESMTNLDEIRNMALPSYPKWQPAQNATDTATGQTEALAEGSPGRQLEPGPVVRETRKKKASRVAIGVSVVALLVVALVFSGLFFASPDQPGLKSQIDEEPSIQSVLPIEKEEMQLSPTSELTNIGNTAPAQDPSDVATTSATAVSTKPNKPKRKYTKKKKAAAEQRETESLAKQPVPLQPKSNDPEPVKGRFDTHIFSDYDG